MADSEDIDYSGYDSAYCSDEEEEIEAPASPVIDDEEEGVDDGISPMARKRMRKCVKLGNIEAEWVQGKRQGSEKVIFQGAQYTVDASSKSGRHLFGRCDVRAGCSSRLWINSETRRLHLLTGEHNHQATPWRPVVTRVRHEQMQMIEGDTDLAPSAVVKRTTEHLDDVESMFLPRKQNQARAVATRKRNLLGLPTSPLDIHFELPETLKFFTEGERFLLYDSGVADEKVGIAFLSARRDHKAEDGGHRQGSTHLQPDEALGRHRRRSPESQAR